MSSDIGKLQISDWVKSALSAVFAAIVVAIGGVVSQPNFDLFTVDWVSLIHLIVNVGVATFLGDISRRLASDKEGKLFGKI